MIDNPVQLSYFYINIDYETILLFAFFVFCSLH
jgi:hypothetical protein